MNKMFFLIVAVGSLIFLSASKQPARTQENSGSDRSQTVALAAIGRPADVTQNEESISPIPHRRITGFLAGAGLIAFVMANSKRRD
jgi:hypothetical protein